MTVTLKLGVGGPGYIALNHFGAFIREAYGHEPYLVGSATRGKQWRDVDRPFGLNPRCSLVTAGISALGKEWTGLPIDFQIQPMTHANERYPSEIRQPLGIWVPSPVQQEGGNQ